MLSALLGLIRSEDGWSQGLTPVQMSVLHLCVLVSMYLVGIGVGTERCFYWVKNIMCLIIK